MFLITPEFSVRIQDIRKVMPHIRKRKNLATAETSTTEGTLVFVVNSHDDIDREFTTVEYKKICHKLREVNHEGDI